MNIINNHVMNSINISLVFIWQKLKEMTASEGALRERVRHLEAEKADLLSATTGLSSDLILEHEDTRNKLMDAELVGFITMIDG